MLTVLIRYRVSRRECVIPATSVEWAPIGAPIQTPPGGKGLQTRDGHPDGPDPNPAIDKGLESCCGGAGLLILNGMESQHLALTLPEDTDRRDVFVMNGQGATVARYTL